MIKVTKDELHELVQSPDTDIILNGPPMFLTGYFNIENTGNEVMFITELPLVNTPGGANSFSTVSKRDSLAVNTALNPGEMRNHIAMMSLNPQTEPGIYETKLMAGGVERNLKVVVQASIDLELTPKKVNFKGVTPGKTYSAQVTFTNKGNVAVTIPNVKHNTMLDADYMCRGLSTAIREKGQDGYMPTMDQLTKNIKKDMAGWVDIEIKEAGTEVKGGASLELHINITLPGDADPKKEYSGDIRLIQSVVLTYHIIP